MKYTTEKILFGLFIFGLILKEFTLPGADLLLLFSAAIASMFYYVMGFFLINDINIKDVLKRETTQNLKPIFILGPIIAGWDFSLIILGILFKIMLFPGADNLLFSGLILLTILTIASHFFVKKKHPEIFKRFFFRASIFVFGAVIFTIITYDNIIDHRYQADHPEYAKALKAYVKTPEDSAVVAKFEEGKEKMNAGMKDE